MLVNKIIKKLESSLNSLKGREGLNLKNSNRNLQKFWPFRFVVFCTTRCNFQCPHCIRQNFDNKKNTKLDFPLDLLDECLLEFKKINYNHVSFTGGEPILHPEFEKLIEAAVKKQFTFNIVSNGWLWRDYFAILEKFRSNLSIINLSLDGSSAEIHDKIRNKPGSYESVIQAIKFYKENGLEVGVQTCFNQLNLSQAENIYKLISSLGVDRWAIMGIDNIIKDESPDYSLFDRDRTFLFNKISDLKSRYKNKISNLNFCSSLHFQRTKIIPFCTNLYFFEPAINPDGKMLFCCDIYKECTDAPDIKKTGFWPAFKINLLVAKKLMLRRLEDINKGELFDGFSACNYCNRYIDEILREIKKEDQSFT